MIAGLRIASDIDGCVANVTPLMRHFIFQTFQYDIHPMSHHNVSIPGLTHEDVTVFIRNLIRKYSDHIYPHSGAINGYENIYRITGEPIHFITARDESIADVTQTWLETHMTVPFKVHYMHSADKPKFLNNGGFGYWIDDRLKIVNMCSENITVFMIKRAWNKDRPINQNVIPVRDVSQACSIWKKRIENSILQ